MVMERCVFKSVKEGSKEGSVLQWAVQRKSLSVTASLCQLEKQTPSPFSLLLRDRSTSDPLLPCLFSPSCRLLDRICTELLQRNRSHPFPRPIPTLNPTPHCRTYLSSCSCYQSPVPPAVRAVSDVIHRETQYVLRSVRWEYC